MTPQTPEELAEEIVRRLRANEVWACSACVPTLSVRTPTSGAVTVSATHSPNCDAIAFWLLLAEPGPPPGLPMPTDPNDPGTTNEGDRP